MDVAVLTRPAVMASRGKPLDLTEALEQERGSCVSPMAASALIELRASAGAGLSVELALER
jgi:hypothetical protein